MGSVPRETVSTLRRAARLLRERAAELEELAAGIEGVSLEGLRVLTGRQAVDGIAALLHVGEGGHYRELLYRLEEEARATVRGEDAAATLLTSLSRDERFRASGGSRGWYLRVR